MCFFRSVFFRVLVLLTLVWFAACSPAPRHTLTNDEKIADLYWVFSLFHENYAPMQYKSTRYGFQFDDLKQRYLANAANTKTNEEFYILLNRFVAEFKDAHTSPSFNDSPLPNRTRVAYLGFVGQRYKDTFLIQDLLATNKGTGSHFPLKIGDQVLALDGASLVDLVANTISKERNLGSDQSNLTSLMSSIFFRKSTRFTLPTKDLAVLTVRRDSKEFEVTLPWVIKDLAVFNAEQGAAAKTQQSPNQGPEKGSILDPLFQLGLASAKQPFHFIPSFYAQIDPKNTGYDYLQNFIFIEDEMPLFTSHTLRSTVHEAIAQAKAQGIDVSDISFDDDDGTPLAELKAVRNIPDGAITLRDAKNFPAYLLNVSMKGSTLAPSQAGQDYGQKNIGYIYLNTFSPKDPEVAVVMEFKNTLLKLQRAGVKDLIIDTLNNGGGSMTLGLQLAQALSRTKLTFPDLQYKVSETWVDQFENNSIFAHSDPEKEIARRIFAELRDKQALGQSLSQRWNVESLMPYQVSANTDLLKDFNIIVLTNEMCASMCDIFASIMQDNKLGLIMGSQTMGAGGNVVDHREAPNSHLGVRQTESLIVRLDGSYLENNGVTPNIELPPHTMTKDKYQPLIDAAIATLSTVKIGSQP